MSLEQIAKMNLSCLGSIIMGGYQRQNISMAPSQDLKKKKMLLISTNKSDIQLFFKTMRRQ